MKNIVFILIILVSCSNVFSQEKRFDITVVLDDSIDSEKIFCRYNNGKDDIPVKGAFIKNLLNVKGRFYSKFISFHIEYRIDKQNSYANEFFIDNHPAKIILKFQPDEPDNVLGYKTVVNAMPIYDTVDNIFFKHLALYRIVEAQAVSDFWGKNAAQIFRNDSLRQVSNRLFKNLNTSTISFLRNHSQDYLSFWYFRKQVVESSLSLFANDKPYLKSLLDTMKTIYPKKYVESSEGQLISKLIYNLVSISDPPKLNSVAPGIKFIDINGKKIDLAEHKGRYFLLDFWASWCGPCIRELSFIKQLRNEYSKEKLEIIGISDDRGIDDLKRAILKYGINWTNVFDKNKTILNLFGVRVIPVTILINGEGIIIYDSREKEDKEQLVRLLKGM